jgi:hypothetical protein
MSQGRRHRPSHPVHAVVALTLMITRVVLCEISHHRGALTVSGLVLLAAGMAWLLSRHLGRRPQPT